MKQILILFIAALSFAVMTSCSNAPKGEAAVTKAAEAVKKSATAGNAVSYKVQPGSLVEWTGSKLAGKHTGTFQVSEGTLQSTNGVITGGKFTIDMNSLVCTDLKAGEGKEDIEGHLKSPDFFDVAKNPTSTFEITGVNGNQATGNLTLNGVTKSITIPFNANVLDQGIKLSSPDFTINRTDFNMKYGSSTFMDVVKDKAINDQVGLKISLRAKA